MYIRFALTVKYWIHKYVVSHISHVSKTIREVVLFADLQIQFLPRFLQHFNHPPSFHTQNLSSYTIVPTQQTHQITTKANKRGIFYSLSTKTQFSRVLYVCCDTSISNVFDKKGSWQGWRIKRVYRRYQNVSCKGSPIPRRIHPLSHRTKPGLLSVLYSFT